MFCCYFKKTCENTIWILKLEWFWHSSVMLIKSTPAPSADADLTSSWMQQCCFQQSICTHIFTQCSCMESANASKMKREGLFLTYFSAPLKIKLLHTDVCNCSRIFSKQNTSVHVWFVLYMKNKRERKKKLAVCANLWE